ncbi:MAG: hypothetical protein RLZZ299_26 [Pseudomonadota bacterium]
MPHPDDAVTVGAPPTGSGAELRAAREARGWTLDHVSRELHVDPKFLDAIERDDDDALPRGPYAQGWRDRYRSLLGLAAAPAPRPTPTTSEVTITETTGAVSRRWARVPLGVGVALGIVLAITASWRATQPKPVGYDPPDMHLSIAVEDIVAVRVVADGRETFRGMLGPASRQVFHARDRLELELPRLEGVNLGWKTGSYDGKPLPVLAPLGSQGRPRTLVFIDDGAP